MIWKFDLAGACLTRRPAGRSRPSGPTDPVLTCVAIALTCSWEGAGRYRIVCTSYPNERLYYSTLNNSSLHFSSFRRPVAWTRKLFPEGQDAGQWHVDGERTHTLFLDHDSGGGDSPPLATQPRPAPSAGPGADWRVPRVLHPTKSTRAAVSKRIDHAASKLTASTHAREYTVPAGNSNSHNTVHFGFHLHAKRSGGRRSPNDQQQQQNL